MPLSRFSSRVTRSIVRRWAARIAVSTESWTDLTLELDRWKPGQAKFWWRDDDATAYTLPLKQLLALSERVRVPLALAVIPAQAKACLPDALMDWPNVCVLAHGWSHHNHAPSGAPGAELAPGRSAPEVYRELSQGRSRLEDLFGPRFHLVQVPPHNLVAPSLVRMVAQAGFHFISIDRDFTGLRMPSRNIHVDVIDWQQKRALDDHRAVQHVVAALKLRRYGLVNASLPIGLLTHHLVHDSGIWAVTERLLRHLTQHPAVSFPSATDIFSA